MCADGEIKITGYRASNQLKEIANHQSEWQNIIAIAAGGGGTDADIGRGHTVGLREDKTVVAVGDNQYGQCDVGNWTDIVAIAAGQWHTVGLHSDGTVVAVGNDGNSNFNTYDNACAVDSWTDIIAIAAGSGYTIGLKSDGSVVYTGYNDNDKGTNMEDWNNILYFEGWNADRRAVF